MQFFYEDGHGSIMNEEGKEATSILEEKSFRLKSLADLRKFIKNQKLQLEVNECDVIMEDSQPKKERATQYNVYTDKDRRRYFFFP
ncbi:hypothetical protein RO3G_09399 [Rhizopus delemar RA 99-880]|uniref:Uncharacterized protein n=1 Tax=Rhizopus delemar (strain RA 99-880 / ATCC MYA-4621 / FGSC 9543 / NRRL 43880) TaxID=246409 RepID=I1C8A9_RHIO9|nr:hypothetical protein RO3G_09399 [Rhizopus delemar RA 99-880]|eukprot:EIE84689.1 hypothetical protein RO3G_09399 [Rhizopus delemar RA 99-880]